MTACSSWRLRETNAFAGATYVVYGSKPDEAVVRIGTAIANTIHGGDFDDVLAGLQGDGTFDGHGGDDRLTGGGGSGVLSGGGGDVFVYGSASPSTSTHFYAIKR